MLVSHRKKFIFTKTVKTAGTSVESYFEQYCMPDGEWQASHNREAHISEAGIIGYRGLQREGKTWYGHMPAARIRELIGQAVWDNYFKFTVIRNPFDKLISGFYFKEKRKKYYGRKRRLIAFVNKILGIGDPIDSVSGGTDVERFRSWIRTGDAVIDRDKYMLDGVECVDFFIRFEDLSEGVKHVCERLSIPYDPSRIPEFKKGIRNGSLNIRDYYDEKTKRMVQEKYAWELERFGYDLP